MAELLHRTWRSSLILTFASCYIMWGKFDTQSVLSIAQREADWRLLPSSDYIHRTMASSHRPAAERHAGPH